MQTARFRFEAGLFVKRQVLRTLREMAWDEGAEYSMTDDGGWLSRVYFVTATGGRAQNLAQRFMHWIEGATGRPRWTPENRPVVDGSKPASGAGAPSVRVFYRIGP